MIRMIGTYSRLSEEEEEGPQWQTQMMRVGEEGPEAKIESSKRGSQQIKIDPHEQLLRLSCQQNASKTIYVIIIKICLVI